MGSDVNVPALVAHKREVGERRLGPGQQDKVGIAWQRFARAHHDDGDFRFGAQRIEVIEIGDAGDNVFLESLKRKYRKVDLFLDDGGHTMQQQIITMKEMLPHIEPDGVYMCEDLSTSWSEKFGGMSYKTHDDESFRETTMFGLVHRSLDWLNAGWIPGGVMKYKADDERLKSVFWRKDPWWKEFSSTVKHIHCYNQLIVYEKGLVETPFATKTKGKAIPYGPSGKHPKVDWKIVMDILRSNQ